MHKFKKKIRNRLTIRISIFISLFSFLLLLSSIFDIFNINNIGKTENTNWYIKQLDSQTANDFKNLSGKNIKIGLIDSGVSSFNKSVENQFNFSNSKDISDNIGHGTTNASLINEISPNSKIFSYKVTDSDDSVSEENFIKALEQADKDSLNILCIPMGYHQESEKIISLINKLNSKNVLVVASVGNYNEKNILFPGNQKNVIPIGAQKEDLSAWSNNNGSKENYFLFPGVDVNGYVRSNEKNDFKQTKVSGTSYATSIASAYYSLIMQKKIDTNQNYSYEYFKDISYSIELSNYKYYYEY